MIIQSGGVDRKQNRKKKGAILSQRSKNNFQQQTANPFCLFEQKENENKKREQDIKKHVLKIDRWLRCTNLMQGKYHF
jgi:hypothetical protein